ncbi:PAS domain S-box protein, partial [Candidatus Marithioploca araucensis]|nr:PAS domain S-box protein [Candidatus Marithioploca araucensis]
EILLKKSEESSITESKQIQQAQLESDALWRSITQNSPDHIISLDRELKIQFINHTAPGLTVEQVTGTPIYNYIAEEKQGEVKAKLETVLATNKAIRYETEYVASTGEMIYYESRATPRIVSGQTVGILVFARDITERINAKIALQESKDQIELLLNSTAEGIFAIDLDCKCTLCNSASLKLLGYNSAEELVGQIIHDLIHHSYKDGSSYPPEECKVYQSLRKAENIHCDDEMFWRADGTCFPVEYWSHKILQNGKPIGAVITFIDISERKQAVLALQKSAVELTQLIDTANAPIFGIDKEGKVNEWNQTAQRITGFIKEDVLGHGLVKEFILNEYQNQVKTVLEHALQGEETSNYEFPLETKDGKRLMILLNASTRRDMDDKIIGVIGVGQNITARKEAEQKLAQLNQELEYKVQQRTEELQAANEELQTTNKGLQDITKALQASRAGFNSIVDKLSFGIMVINQENIIQYLNPTMQSLFSHAPLAIGKEFAVPTTYPGERIEVRVTLSEEEIGIAEMYLVKTLWEEKPAYLIMLHEITELKKAQADLENERASLARRVDERTGELSKANAELARASRLKNEFLANMSHELRTPLNAIIGMSELLLDDVYGEINEGQLKAIKHIDNGGRHLLSLINDILDLSKIEAGKMKLEQGNVIIDGTCRSSIQMVKQIATKKQISVRFASDDNVKTIFADERAVKQILVNLLNNAIKFTHPKGKVTLELHGDKVNKVAKINVIDTGIGVPEHELDNLFEPFVQIDSRLNRQHEGTGLGLALVYKLIELHGGSI